MKHETRVFFVLSCIVGGISGCRELPTDPTQLFPGTGSGSGTGTVSPVPTSTAPVPDPTPTSVPTTVPSGGPTPVSSPTPAPTSSPSPVPSSTPAASTCVSSDPNHICIGLKFVAYQDGTGIPTVNQADSQTLVEQISTIWAACNVGFQVDQYEAVDPTTVGLVYGSGSENDLTSIRSQYSDDSTFLVVITGPWTGSTIAWTELPGGGPFGTIVDDQYGHNPMTVGHELGHYQGLLHVSDSTNLMNPYIGSNTSALTSSQCDSARATDLSDWQAMLRK